MAINLGDINFGLGPDTRRLDQARQSVLQFGQAVNQAARSQAEGARQAEAALRRQEKAILNSLQSTLKLNDAIRQTGANDRLIQTTTNTFNRLVKELGSGQVSALQFQRSMEDFQASTGRVNRALAEHRNGLRETEKAQRALEKSAAATTRTQERQARESIRLAFDAARAQEQGIMKQNAALHSAQLAVDRYNASVDRLKKSQRAAFSGRADSALNVLKTQLDAAGNSALKFQQAQQTFQRSMAQMNSSLATFRSKAKSAADSGLEAALRRMADVSVLLHGPLSGIATRLTLISSLSENVSLKMAGLVVGISAAVYGFTQLGMGAINAARELERIDQTLTALHDSTTLANIDMNYLMQLSDRAGSQFETTAKQFARLTAASQGTNLEGENTRRIFEQVLFASQKLGSSNEELAGTLKAIEQIMSKGKVQAEELRGQLGDRLPGAINIMATALGVGTDKLDDMMKKGQLTSGVLVKFAEELSRRLGVDTTKAIDNVTAAENRLTNANLRFRNSVDETLRFSAAYKNVLEGLVIAMDWLGSNVTNIAKVFGAATGAIVAGLAAMYAPAILSGFMVIVTTLRTLTAVMWGLTAATLANPFGALASILVRVGAAATGAVVGFELMSKAIGDTNQAHFGALPGVKAYIDAQTNMKSSIRATTEEYIKQQEVMLQGIRNRMAEISRLQETEKDQFWSDAAPGIPRLWGNMVGQDEALRGSVQRMAEWRTEMERLTAQEQDAAADMQKLTDILNKQTATEEKRTTALNAGADASEKSAKGAERMKWALDAANDSIRETEEALRIMMLPKWQQTWAKAQAEINKSVDDFRDKLEKAKIPQEQVTALTERYAEAVRGLKEGEIILQSQTTLWEALAGTLGSSMDQAMNTLVDGIIEGKDALELLRDVGKSVATDLIKTFLQLAAINPLKNLLFGVNPSTGVAWPTLTGGSGGGLLGGLIGGLGKFLGLGAAANGMAVMSGGQRFRQGGTFSSPTMFNTPGGPVLGGEAGPEALMPLTRNSRGQLSVRAEGGGRPIVVNISTPDIGSFKKSESQVAAMFTRFGQRGLRNS